MEQKIDISHLKEKLLQMESAHISEMEINNFTGSKKTVRLDQQSVGRLFRIDAIQAQQMALEFQKRREVQLAAVRAALHQIGNNDYDYHISFDCDINPKTLRCKMYQAYKLNLLDSFLTRLNIRYLRA
ncbi:hypothetical protein SNE98_002031 [Vibrio cholerae]|nr:hypothetical protein [Vibrio cholerae]ELJ8518767.1 hypothetical protein [Vibrio cholerae]ELY5215045.1 hypothetical protein [Vibrio cholerae]